MISVDSSTPEVIREGAAAGADLLMILGLCNDMEL